MSFEYCITCGQKTGRAGKFEDSIYIQYEDQEVGPLCKECRHEHFVCNACGAGVYPKDLSLAGRHIGCWGLCE